MDKATGFDLDRIRADTPATAGLIHLNNAGAALPPEPVTRAVCDHIALEAELGGYEAADAESARIEAVYDSLARLVNAARSEIALVPHATAAWQLAFYALDFREGDRILTARAEYAANYVAYLQMSRRTGCVIETIPDDEAGAIDTDALERMIDGRVKLVSVTWLPTNGGLVNPAAEIGRIARAHGVPYLLDACQAVGQMPVDVEALGCDFLSATGRKFLRGPRGTGFLYVRKSWLDRIEPPMLDHYGAPWVSSDAYELRSDARRFECWEKPYALTLGLGAAADYALALGLETIRDRAWHLAETLRAGLARIPGVTVRDLGHERSAIVTFDHDRVPAGDIKAAMRGAGINVSVSSPSSTLLDATARALPPVVRVSPHYYNSEAEIAAVLDRLEEIAGQ